MADIKSAELLKSPPFNPALVVIDMQNDFVTGSLAVQDAASIIEPINQVLALPFSLKVGTKDFHPNNHISFASTHNKSVFDKITIHPPQHLLEKRPPDAPALGGLEQVLWPDHCVASTPGAEFAKGLDYEKFDATIHKGTDTLVESYSAFIDPWGLAPTDLPSILSRCGITDVFVVGVAGDFCVKFTAIDAAKFGFKTWVVKDLVRSVGNEGREWEEMETYGVKFLESAELKEKIASAVV